MDPYPFIVLFHHILRIILAVSALKFSSPIIFYRKLLTNISPVLMYFFIFTIIWSVLLLIQKIYSVGYWRPVENEYNALMLYWTGLFPQILVFLGTILETFLCLDRCASILIPVKYSLKYRKYFSFATLICLIAYVTVFLFINNLFKSIPTSTVSKCLIFGCLIRDVPNLTATKYATVSSNIFCGCILFLLIKNKLKSNDQKNKHLSHTVLIIIATTSFSELFPTALSSYFTNVHNIRINDIIGPYSPTLTSINVTISAWLYSKAFRETFKLSSINEVRVGAVSVFAKR